ncbi:conserved hypothetical protein [Streptomyces sp. Mg1]|nr:conserved hypothetical protein [Streptomyces sp. Mg1]
MRAPAADAFTEVLLTDLLRVLRLRQLRYFSRLPLINAGRPVRSSVPSPYCNNPGFDTPPPHRPAEPQLPVLRVLLPGSSSLPGPSVSLGYERNHN